MYKRRKEWIKDFHNETMKISEIAIAFQDWHEEVETITKDRCDEDAEIRRFALTVLPEIEVNGNADGVPSIVDIVEKLTEKINPQLYLEK